MVETIKHYKPKLFIEIHSANLQRRIENALNIVNFLVEKGYSLYHIESKNKINKNNANIAKEGHLYAAPTTSSALES